MIASDEARQPIPSDDSTDRSGSPAETGVPALDLDALYAPESEALIRVVAARTRDREVAMDIVQEAFVRLVSAVDAGRPPDRPKAWLVTVSLNLAATWGRHASVERRHASGLLAAGSTHPSPEETVGRRERDDAVRSALAGLPGDARLGLVLASEGYSSQEIARSLGRSEGATRTLLCRARRRLRPHLAVWYGAAG